MNTSLEPNLVQKMSIKVFGVGGAGCNALDSFARVSEISTVALNTDAQSLAKCVAARKFCLGAKTTHGMGTGGDPDLGRSVAEADVEQIKEFCEGANIVFIVAGLGGGTGTSASCVVAQAAKDSGALVLGIVTTPFDFEGGRRNRQAQLGLQQLRSIADAVICLPNEKLFKTIGEKTTVLEAFEMANRFIAQGVIGISRLLTQTGLINVDFADLCSVTRNLHSDTCFASVESSGENRASEILEKIFTHPMLEDGELLENSEALLVSIAAGTDLTMAEVNRVMKEISARCGKSRLIFGALIENQLADRLSITVIASGKSREEKSPIRSSAATSSAAVDAESTPNFLNAGATPRPPARIVAPAPELSDAKKGELLSKQGSRGAKKVVARMRQNELPLEIVSKGRFEKSEPTIHRGEDLDLPTYLRRGIALN
jgi:cell division protein FtsZ